MRWWEGTLHICQHPYAKRYEIDAHTEKCGVCGAVRFIRDRGKLWEPTTRQIAPGGFRIDALSGDRGGKGNCGGRQD